MWYSVIIVALVVLFAAFEQILMIKVINSKAEGTEIEIPKPPAPKKKKKLTPEQEEAKKRAEEEIRKLQILQQNIDVFNGTSMGQREVK